MISVESIQFFPLDLVYFVLRSDILSDWSDRFKVAAIFKLISTSVDLNKYFPAYLVSDDLMTVVSSEWNVLPVYRIFLANGISFAWINIGQRILSIMTWNQFAQSNFVKNCYRINDCGEWLTPFFFRKTRSDMRNNWKIIEEILPRSKSLR